MWSEMLEQPRLLERTFAEVTPAAVALGGSLRTADVVVLLGRGSSRAACTYGAWAMERYARTPAVVASPAELAWGDHRLPLDQALVVAVSQSGESPELVAAAEVARQRGAHVVAVTNVPGSPLEAVVGDASRVLRCQAGPEIAVPATKSLTTSMACLLALAGAGDAARRERTAASIPRLLEDVLTRDRRTVDLAGLDGVVLVGEGAGMAVAEEGAIKIREIARLPTLAMELSEFLHGSINVAQAGVGVVTIALDELSRALSRQVISAASIRGATTIGIGHDASVDAELRLPLPETPPSVGAFLAVGELQRVARDTGLRTGIDPDAPPGLEKITRIGPDAP